jgi:hypothetical protein
MVFETPVWSMNPPRWQVGSCRWSTIVLLKSLRQKVLCHICSVTLLQSQKISLILNWILALSLTVNVANAKLVACVGDSITYGSGISNRQYDSYPAQLSRMLQKFDNQ